MKRLLYSALFAICLMLTTSCEENESTLISEEFADATYVCSILYNIQSTPYIAKGTMASFMDLSHNPDSHTWELLDEGCYFLDTNEINSEMDDYTPYILADYGSSCSDELVSVLFAEAGTKVIRLYNEFYKYVSYTGITQGSEYTTEAVWNEEKYIWEFIEDITFYVLDDLSFGLEVYDQDGTKLAAVGTDEFPSTEDRDSWPTVNVPVDNELTYVIVDATGEPTSTTWTLNLASGGGGTGGTESYTAAYTNIGTSVNAGNVQLTRNNDNYSNYYLQRPVANLTKSIPLKITVVAPTSDLISTSQITSLSGSNQIELYVGTDLAKAGDPSNFSISASHDGSPLSISVTDVAIKSSDIKSLTLTLSDKIYVDDSNITLSYTAPSDSSMAVVDNFDRELASFSSYAVSPEASNLIEDFALSMHDFEEDGTGTTKTNVENADGIYTLTRSTTRYTSGTQSLRIHADEIEITKSLAWYIGYQANDDTAALLDLSTDCDYIVKLQVYIETAFPSGFTPRIRVRTPWVSTNFTFVDIPVTDLALNQWHELNLTVPVASYSGGTGTYDSFSTGIAITFYNPSTTVSAEAYIDAIEVYRSDAFGRPE
ncbi:MAG: hypothetical protein SNI54_07865 [Rikenellaceae bacterium]